MVTPGAKKPSKPGFRGSTLTLEKTVKRRRHLKKTVLIHKEIKAEYLRDGIYKDSVFSGSWIINCAAVNIVYKDCLFVDTTFTKRTTLVECIFINCNFKSAIFLDANLSRCSFRNCNFEDAVFTNVEGLESCNFDQKCQFNSKPAENGLKIDPTHKLTGVEVPDCFYLVQLLGGKSPPVKKSDGVPKHVEREITEPMGNPYFNGQLIEYYSRHSGQIGFQVRHSRRPKPAEIYTSNLSEFNRDCG